jgi:hypothetical protein
MQCVQTARAVRICSSQTLFDQSITSRIRLLVLRTRAINVLTVITAKGHNRMKYFTIDNENDIRVHASATEADAVTNAERFSTSAGLTKLAENWPVARLVEIWNSLPGATPVKKFTDRATAASRIWKAIQHLGKPPAGNSGAAPTEEPAAVLTSEAVEAAIPTAFQPEHEVAPVSVSVPEPVVSEPEAAAEVAEAMPTEPPISKEPPTENLADVSAQAPDVAPEPPTSTKKATRAKKTPTEAPSAKAPRENSKTSQVIAMLRREGGATLDEIVNAMTWQKHTARAMMSAGGSLAKKHGLVIISEKVGDSRTYSIKA